MKRSVTEAFAGRRNAVSLLVLPLCRPAAVLYGAIMRLRRHAYARGWAGSAELPVPVVSVGNITVGGTGKTPLIRSIAGTLSAAGVKPAVISRGYRGSHTGTGVVGSGSGILMTADQAGDEPVQLARQLPGIPVLVGRDRAAAGMFAISHFAPDLILLDDGLQHLQLKRDLDIVLIDATNPFGNGSSLPCGPLREPVSVLKQADAIVLTKVNQVSGTPAAYARLAALGLENRVSEAPFTTDTVTAHPGGTPSPVSLLEAHPDVFAFCGLGNPASFFTSCREVCRNITGTAAFPDHHAYTPDDIASIRRQAASTGARALLTTEKDCARLPDNPFGMPLYSLNMTMPCPAAVIELILKLLEK